MRYVHRLNDFAGTWWPLLGSFAAVAVIATMGFVFLSVADDRERQAAELVASEERNKQLADIIEAEQRSQETRDERLAGAVGQVRQVLAEIVADHDEQVNRLFQRQLAQIAELLNRPAPAPPAAAKPPPPTPSSPPATSAPRPTATTSPPRSSPPATSAPTPAPTEPRQKSCDRRPNGPHC